MGFVSRTLNTRFRRALFVVTAIPATCAAVMLIASGYFYYKVYFSDRTLAFECHQGIAQRELGITAFPDAFSAYFSKDATRRDKLARERADHPWSSEVWAIERGSVYQRCLQNSYLAGDVLNIRFALIEARNFAFWTAVILLLVALGRVGHVVYRWIMMR